MSVSTIQPTIMELTGSFTAAPPERLDEEWLRLTEAVWNAGSPPRRSALAAVPALVTLLDELDDRRKGYVAILLGLIAESEHPAYGELHAAVRRGLDRYLDLLRSTPVDEPLSLALRYLVAHFPDDRDAVLAAVADLDVPSDDLARLDRALDRLDPDAPVLGRVFPSPSVWELDEAEREFDQAWIAKLSPEQVRHNWNCDTRTVLGHAGAKAYWAVRNGRPEPTVPDAIPSRDAVRKPAADPCPEIFRPHAAAFRCPHCGSGLEFEASDARCTGCGTAYPLTGGILNLSTSEGAEDTEDFLRRLSEIPTMGLFYETLARPAFLRISGSNWGGIVTRAVEDAYIAEHVRPLDGPVLDLGAGAGSWSAVLAEAVGHERVIALDVNPAMLTLLRSRLPRVASVLASASALPFGDETLGAVLCWNALQAFPDDAPAAIAEVGRCLRPGGTFTIMTFRMADDPVARYFQRCHHLPQHTDGLRLFDVGELTQWLTSAGLIVRETWYPGTFVFIAAEKAG